MGLRIQFLTPRPYLRTKPGSAAVRLHLVRMYEFLFDIGDIPNVLYNASEIRHCGTEILNPIEITNIHFKCQHCKYSILNRQRVDCLKVQFKYELTT